MQCLKISNNQQTTTNYKTNITYIYNLNFTNYKYVYLNYDLTKYSNILNITDLNIESAKILYNITNVFETGNEFEFIELLFEKGNLDLLKWLNKTVIGYMDLTMFNYFMEIASSKGNLKLMKWIYKNYTFNSMFRSYNVLNNVNEIFTLCVYSGNLNAIKWLKKTFRITKSDALLKSNSALSIASEYGHLNILKWLNKEFKLTFNDYLDNNISTNAAINGYLNILKWIHNSFNILYNELDDIIYWLLTGGYIEAFKWIFDKFKIDITIKLFTFVVEHGNVKIAKKFIKMFNFDITKDIEEIKKFSLHRNMYEWLCDMNINSLSIEY